MATVGLIGTGLAYLNLKKAEKEYNALVEKQDALLAALQTMRDEKANIKTEKEQDIEEPDWVDPDPIDLMDGISCTTVLRVGAMQGKLFHTQAVVVITNNSDKEYYIQSVTADCFVLGCWVVPFRLRDWWKIGRSYLEEQKQHVVVGKVIRPGDVLEVVLPGGESAIYTKDGVDKLPELRNMIASAAGKKLITSVVQSFNIVDGEKADIKIVWYNMVDGKVDWNGNGKINNDTILYRGRKYHVTLRKPGTLRYVFGWWDLF